MKAIGIIFFVFHNQPLVPFMRYADLIRMSELVLYLSY